MNEGHLKTGVSRKEPSYRFDFDPTSTPMFASNKSASDLYRIKFLKYLNLKSLNIDIWDADSKMLFGSVKIALRDLLRQGKKGVVVPRQYQIID